MSLLLGRSFVSARARPRSPVEVAELALGAHCEGMKCSFQTLEFSDLDTCVEDWTSLHLGAVSPWERRDDLQTDPSGG